MKTLTYLPLVTCSLVLIGCSVSYDITMKPVEGGLERTTSVTGSLSTFEKESLTNVFGEHREEHNLFQKKSNVWEGVVNNEWDDGIGGLGSWTKLTSPLGSVETFMESFGGNANIAEYVETLMFVIEASEKEVQKHLQEVLVNNPLLEKVQILLKDRILNDAKDLALMVLSNTDYFSDKDAPKEQPRNNESDQMRFHVNFLWQRGWLNNNEAPLYLYSWINSWSAPSDLSEIENIVCNALELDIQNAEDAKQIRELIKKITPLFSDEYAKSLWGKIKETIAANGYDGPQFIIMSDIFSKAVGFNYELITTLETETKPVTTNGVWDEQTNTLTFTMDSIPQSAGYFMLPTLWHAAWEFPNSTYQEKIFGNKILIDELMYFNTAWHEGTETARSKVHTFLTLRGQDREAGRPWETKKILRECFVILRNINP